MIVAFLQSKELMTEMKNWVHCIIAAACNKNRTRVSYLYKWVIVILVLLYTSQLYDDGEEKEGTGKESHSSWV